MRRWHEVKGEGKGKRRQREKKKEQWKEQKEIRRIKNPNKRKENPGNKEYLGKRRREIEAIRTPFFKNLIITRLWYV